MKALLIFALLATVSVEAFSYEKEYASDPLDILRGFLKGIGETNDIKDIIDSLDKLKPGWEEVGEGIKIMLLSDFVKGFEKMTNGLKIIFEEIIACLNKYPKLKTLIKGIITADPDKIYINIAANLVKYTRMIIEALDCLKYEDFMCVGSKLGEILKSIFMEGMGEVVKRILNEVVKEVKGTNHLFEFLKGFLNGIGDKTDPSDLLKCLNTLEETFKKIQEALFYIIKGDLDEKIKGMIMLLEALREMLAKIKPCIEGLEEVKKLVNAIINADIAKILKRVLLNLNIIVAEIAYTYKCIQEGNLNCAGFGIGSLFKFIFLS